MRMDTTLHQRMSQEMTLAPRMIQAMKILQMPIMDLQERLQQELDENPVLEQREPGDEIEVEEMAAVVQAERDERHDPGAAELVIDESKGELDFDRLDALSRDY